MKTFKDSTLEEIAIDLHDRLSKTLEYSIVFNSIVDHSEKSNKVQEINMIINYTDELNKGFSVHIIISHYLIANLIAFVKFDIDYSCRLDDVIQNIKFIYCPQVSYDYDKSMLYLMNNIEKLAKTFEL